MGCLSGKNMQEVLLMRYMVRVGFTCHFVLRMSNDWAVEISNYSLNYS